MCSTVTFDVLTIEISCCGSWRRFFRMNFRIGHDLRDIVGFRICCTPKLHVQVFMKPQTEPERNYYIRALHKDIGSIPLPCIVDIIHCAAQDVGIGIQDTEFAIEATAAEDNAKTPVALLVSIVDPHSIAMAAISRKQLLAAGYRVELLIYPDTDGAAAWLWNEALADFNPTDFCELAVIGDRPDASLTGSIVDRLAQWRAAGVRCTVLNRHEANWGRAPALLELGVIVVLGGDWAYFWGDLMDETVRFWGQIASLCTRDPDPIHDRVEHG